MPEKPCETLLVEEWNEATTWSRLNLESHGCLPFFSAR